MRLGASFTDKSAERDVEVRALLFAAIDAESVEGVLDQQRLYQLGLLGRLPLKDGNGRRHLRRRNELEVRVGRQLLMWLLVKLGFPGGEQVFGELSTFKWRHSACYRHLRLSHWSRLVPGYLSSWLQRSAWLRHVRMCKLLRLMTPLRLRLIEVNLLELVIDALNVAHLIVCSVCWKWNTTEK